MYLLDYGKFELQWGKGCFLIKVSKHLHFSTYLFPIEACSYDCIFKERSDHPEKRNVVPIVSCRKP